MDKVIKYWIAFFVLILVVLLFAECLSPNFKGLFSIGSSVLLSFLFPFVLNNIKTIPSKWISFLLLTIVLLVYLFIVASAIVHINYFFINNEIIDEHSFLAIFQSDPGEMMSFITENSTTTQIIGFVIIVIGLIFLFLKFYNILGSNPKSFSIKQFSLLMGGFILLFLIPRFGLATTTFVFDNINLYQTELSKFKALNQQYNAGKSPIIASKKNTNELYVVVLGESLSREHMSLYGYHRKTTPYLDSLNQNNELLVFNNVVSNHTHTTPTLSYALTSANQYNAETFEERTSIVNMFKAAKFKTAWVSNQVRYGIWDNHVGVIADNSDDKTYFNKYVGKTFKNRNDDEIVLGEVNRLLNVNSKENKVIFVHLIGNHFPYTDRYTKSFEKFTTELSIGEFGKTTNHMIRINAYDNSIVYNDYIINQLIKQLQQSSFDVKGLIYLPDHAEEVWERKSHQSKLFTYSMVESPLIIWLSEKYKSKYPGIYENLKTNLDTYWSNDLFYDLLIGISNIQTDKTQKHLSLTNDLYSLPVSDIKTLHGRKNYIDNLNFDYHIKENVKWLKENKLLDRILPHRVNTIGKLNYVRKYGFNSFEIDVLLKDKNGQQLLMVGHDNKTLTEKTLEDFLADSPSSLDYKIWVDVKNLNINNLNKMSARLDELESKYDLSSKAIIESKIKSPLFSSLSDKGFHTSYYLPTNLGKIEDKATLKKQARQIAKQIKSQKVKAISFDRKVYSFVKEYLEALIDSNIVYHTWDLQLNIKKESFIDALKGKDYFEDSRVQTILIKFATKYDH